MALTLRSRRKSSSAQSARSLYRLVMPRRDISRRTHYKFGWLQGSPKSLRHKKVWLHRPDLNQRLFDREPNATQRCGPRGRSAGQTTFGWAVPSISSVIFLVQEKVRTTAPIGVSLLGLLVVARTCASHQEIDPKTAIGIRATYRLPPDGVIDEINFVGLRRITTEAAKSRLSVHSGEPFDSARIAGDLRALNQLGWLEDVLVTAEESD